MNKYRKRYLELLRKRNKHKKNLIKKYGLPKKEEVDKNIQIIQDGGGLSLPLIYLKLNKVFRSRIRRPTIVEDKKILK